MISLLTNSPWSIFVINILDIAIIAFAVYKILEIMRGTRAMPLAKGVGVLLVFSVLSDVLGLSTVNWVLVQLQTMFIVAIPVVFAPELRRALEQLGTGGIFARSRHLSDNDLVAHQVQQICGCMTAASASRSPRALWASGKPSVPIRTEASTNTRVPSSPTATRSIPPMPSGPCQASSTIS